MRLARSLTLSSLVALAACGSSSSRLGSTEGASKEGAVATPSLTCASATETTLDVTVAAGEPTGLPAGFTLQWMPAAAYATGGWSDAACDASFSGNAKDSRYALAAGASVTVRVGDFLLDNGASTSCPGALACGTEYAFRAFGHATKELFRSDFTEPVTFATLPCSACTYTQGYWKTHGPTPNGNNAFAWPDAVKADGLALGSVAYTPAELLAILGTPVQGNGLLSLAHQLVAAKLNVANGAVPTALDGAIDDADALVGALVVPPVGAGWLAPKDTSALTGALGAWNEGLTGPGHCE